ncbi:Maf1-domain-containing protein [Fistulina hepatica ATCC 64428]|nr:Maf1-domain-containing protein [Fistulina hepatica ATCC 64428]
MKFIDSPSLARLSKSLTHRGPECSVQTRIELYSCKSTRHDNKLFKSLELAYHDEISNSPPGPSWLALDREAEMTPFGPFGQHSSRKTLYLLISTLNNAFRDHEFSDARPSHFSREESGASILNALSTTLVSQNPTGLSPPRTYSSYPPTSRDFFPSSVPTSSSPYDSMLHGPLDPPPIVAGTHPDLYRVIDEAIGVADCEVYSYEPGVDADPNADDDFDADEDEVASDSESADDDDATFEFDDYDIDESSRTGTDIPQRSSSPLKYRRATGSLLWSSHWFFFNRKLKRILYITVWARSRGAGRSWTDGEDDISSVAGHKQPERFVGWEGGVGAGARALGLKVSA